MIEIVDARSGDKVLKWNGRYLSSSVDPIDEAKKWVKARSEKIKNFDQIILLGLGSGYVLTELERSFPKIKFQVIEREKQIVDQFLSKHSSFTAKFIVGTAPELILQNTELQKVLSGLYGVLRFSLATIDEKGFYDEIEEHLIGRSHRGFNYLLSIRSDLREWWAAQSQAVDFFQEPITIKSIDEVVKGNQSNLQFDLIWKSLREIIT